MSHESRFILELAPFIVAIVSIIVVFLYLTVRLLVIPKKPKRIKKQQKYGDEPLIDERIDEVVVRAEDLLHRVQNLEEIVNATRKPPN